ncbi:site-specific integrase [Enterococcus faecium]|nr:site-specific integrase [Enterococcus faecium]MDQ8543548.1 site-specific integrase [Enterococcus faecium]MDQ8555333.1 site-specific integrase [Enterococcus faecium]
MWIETKTDKNGKKVYKYNERYIDPKTRKRKKVSITYKNKSRETQKVALLELNKKIDIELNEKTLQKPNLTFHELVEEWLVIYKRQVKESTYYPTNNILNTIKKKIPETYIVSGINTVDLNNIFEDMIYKDDLSNKYVSVIKSKLNLLFSYAMKKGYVEKNPINEVVIDYKRESKTIKIKDKFLEDDEYKRLVDFTTSHNKRYSLLFQWLYLTGMRPGEAIALSKDDVHITNNNASVVINGTMMYRERSIADMKKSDSTKTAAGMREIDLPKKAIAIYNELLELNPKGQFLFQTTKGTPFQLTAINTYLRNHKADMKINKKLSSHIFRHTHISKLAELGTPLYAIQDRVGHENSDITEKIYLHVTKGVKEKLKEDIEKL